ncbi:MAG TPA: GAF domain-containing sensor histidine kinase [Candidatus Bathyarchaeia archaeon]|nr:GAF domain-containing sensor histidine kinase [Candidatus Bathyarchaeia archaeon]
MLDLQAEETGAGKFSTRDLAAFNRWLCFTRLRAAAAIALFFPLLSYLDVARIEPRPVLAICLGLAVLSVVGLRAGKRVEGSLVFFCVQTLADLGAITAGIGLAAQGWIAQLARPLYVMVIVPSSLVSVPIGLAVAALATAAHGMLLLLEHDGALSSLATFEFLGPSFLFFLIAQQSFFYGGRLAEKNVALTAVTERLKESQRRLADEGRLSAELVEAARILSATLDAPEPLPGFVRTIGERLWADWSAIFELDGEPAFRLRSASNLDVAGGDLDRIALPLSSWPALERLRSERAIVLDGADAQAIPPLFSEGTRLGTVLVAALRRDGVLVGFVAAGYEKPLDGERCQWTLELLAGIAEHATIVLQSAQLLEEVRVASALKSEFVGAVSHELRSPLNVILGYLEMMLDRGLGPLSREQADALERAQRQGTALLEMIEALLDLNRFEAGRLPLEIAPVSLVVLLGQVRDQLPRAWCRPGVTLRLEVDPSLPVIETDQRKLKTIVRNLAHNALKFTAEGHVTLSAAGAAGEVSIAVADSGCGIPPEALSYVFDMFRQVPGTTGGGVGLGLHIVRRFVEALGGRVTVTSQVGVGTCFTVTLPVHAPAAREVTVAAAAAQAA